MPLELDLGKTLTPAELAEILRVCPNTVRKNFHRWGGVEVAPGTYRFFENIVKEVLNANTRQTRSEAPLEGGGDCQWDKIRKKVSRQHTKKLPGRRPMGRRDQAGAQESRDENRYGLAELS